MDLPAWRRRWPLAAVLVALALHFALVTGNWSSGFLVGHEFRQTQTALSAAFIARDGNYSLAYPTPLFGPPWSIPMEFPLYQWATAWLSTRTGWSVAESGRTVSLVCFYLTLPALFLLLRTLRPEDRAGRWLALVPLLCSPVYLFYTRAVLIESMALMFCVWFLWAFAQMCRHRRWRWALIAGVLGALGALVKVTTFMAWCGFAAVGGILWSWRQWREGGWPAWRRSVGLGAVAAVLPGLVSIWWLHTADAIKAASPGGAWLQSAYLRDFNLGTWSARSDPNTWSAIAKHAFQVSLPAWALGAVLIAALWLALRGRDRLPLLALGWCAAVPILFPTLYSFHDYYFYANAAAGLAAAGLMIAALTRHPGLPGRLAPLALVALSAGQLHHYFAAYRPDQMILSSGGTLMTAVVREKLPETDVLIVLGEDWSAAVPYYAQRRAFMVRNSLIADPTEVLRLLDGLGDERVGGLFVTKAGREQTGLIAAIAARFDLDPVPSISEGSSDLHLPKAVRGALLFTLLQDPNYPSIVINPAVLASLASVKLVADGNLQAVTPELADSMFSIASPAPHHYRARFPLEVVKTDDSIVLTAHPESEIWFTTPPGASAIEVHFGLRPESYLQEGTHSDGVEFLVLGVAADGTTATVFRRVLDPVTVVGDRGRQSERVPLPSPRPAQLVFATQPHHTLSFDWAYWQKIAIH